MKHIPTAAWGLFITGLIILIYLSIQKRRYLNAKLSDAETSIEERRFRVGLFGYTPVICLLVVAWGLIIQGVQRWIHSQQGSAIMIVPGLFLLLFFGGSFKGLFASYCLLNSSFVEYCVGIKSLKVPIRSITTVELNLTKIPGYIAIRTGETDKLKLPLHFHDGPKLYATLKMLEETKHR
jgi:hypothetical protein